VRRHTYEIELAWTGNKGTGTSDYTAYGREHMLNATGGKPPIPGSSDPQFRGNADRWNPEELLVASLSACHQLWYLHLAADAGVVVVGYEDRPRGEMVEEEPGGAGQFERVTLRPRVTVTAESDTELAARLHAAAHEKCFVARSVNFPVACEPQIVAETPATAR